MGSESFPQWRGPQDSPPKGGVRAVQRGRHVGEEVEGEPAAGNTGGRAQRRVETALRSPGERPSVLLSSAGCSATL